MKGCAADSNLISRGFSLSGSPRRRREYRGLGGRLVAVGTLSDKHTTCAKRVTGFSLFLLQYGDTDIH